MQERFSYYHPSGYLVLEYALNYSRRLKEQAIDAQDYETEYAIRDAEKEILYSPDVATLLADRTKLTPEINAFLLEIAMREKENSL